MNLSRRTFLHAAAASALGPATSVVRAAPADLPTTVVMLCCSGGHHQMFAAADSLLGQKVNFGVTASNLVMTKGGFGVDASTFGQLGSFVLDNSAAVGVAHGIGDHVQGYRACFFDGSTSLPITLAKAMGGASALKCAVVGPDLPGPHRQIGDVSMQQIPDVSGLLTALGALKDDPLVPQREAAAASLRLAQRLSARRYARNPESLRTLSESNQALLGVLKAPPVSVDWSEVAGAYGLSAGTTAITDLHSRFAAAELLAKTGVNVVMVSDIAPSGCASGYDNHGDVDGNCIRGVYSDHTMGALKTFLNRTLRLTDRRVITVIVSEFGRNNISDHASMLCTNIFGTNIKPGSTARIVDNERMTLAAGTPGWQGFYALLAAAAKAEPVFGANPHDLLVST